MTHNDDFRNVRLRTNQYKYVGYEDIPKFELLSDNFTILSSGS